jgi:hypothetical protein
MPAWDNQPRLDRQVALQGVLTGSVTVWTLPYISREVNYGVLADSAFGSDHGKVIALGNANGTEVFAPGDYTAGCVIVGASYDFKVTVNRVFVRDNQGTAVTRGNLLVREVRTNHRNSGYYTVRSASGNDNVGDKTTSFTSSTNDVEVDGHLDHWIGLENTDLTFTIESDDPRPVTIATLAAEVDHTDKSQ